MDAQDLVYFVVAIVAAISIMAVPGGFMADTPYDPVSADNETQDVVDDIRDVKIDSTSISSALASSLNLFGTIITLPYKLPVLLTNTFPIPSWIAGSMGVVITIMVGFTIINVLRQTKIFR